MTLESPSLPIIVANHRPAAVVALSSTPSTSNERDATNRVAATALTSALGIASHVIAAVDLGLRTSRGSSGGGIREGLFLKHRQPALVDDGIGDGGVLDMRAERLQLFDKLLVAALDVMDGRNLGRAVGDQARYDEGRAAT